MKKICIILLMVLFLITIFSTACNKSTKASMVQAKRRFAQYTEPPKSTNNSVIDLSEGPKLNYDANLGPKKLNFDFKIVDPY